MRPLHSTPPLTFSVLTVVWQAVIASAAFITVYHPPLAWLPVGVLGIATALLFKHTGMLASSVILHMVYNTVVIGYSSF
jgi:membrane protease YdiL (CAAX protease family)